MFNPNSARVPSGVKKKGGGVIAKVTLLPLTWALLCGLMATDHVHFCGSLSRDLSQVIFKGVISHLWSDRTHCFRKHAWDVGFTDLLLGQALCSYCHLSLLLHRLQQIFVSVKASSISRENGGDPASLQCGSTSVKTVGCYLLSLSN